MSKDMGISLSEFAEGMTQPQLASLLGVSQSAISQMLNSDRDIWVRKKSGTWQAIEIKPIGGRRKKVA